MTEKDLRMLQAVTQHPRIGVGSYGHLSGVTLDGKYIKDPRHRSFMSAVRAAYKLIAQTPS
jgi:hypothetical protein